MQISQKYHFAFSFPTFIFDKTRPSVLLDFLLTLLQIFLFLIMECRCQWNILSFWFIFDISFNYRIFSKLEFRCSCITRAPFLLIWFRYLFGYTLLFLTRQLTRWSLLLGNSLYLKIIICFCFSLFLSSAILQVIKVLSWVCLSMAGAVNGAICPWRKSQKVYFSMEGKVSGVRLGAECRLSCI